MLLLQSVQSKDLKSAAMDGCFVILAIKDDRKS